MSSWVRGNCVGKGAFGTVSIAINRSNGQIFAVKSVNLQTSLPSQLNALENEIHILRQLPPSPHVVQFLGHDQTTPYRNLHMEYMPAGTLADVANRNNADVDEDSIRYYTWCLVNALKHVHSNGVVHCDVKGRNVLLTQNGAVAKLADFGSAVEISREESTAGIVPRGSPLWMAPEVVRGEYQGPESDVWSLGCTVIEMVTGKPAWEDHGGETLRRIGFSGEVPEFPSSISELGFDFLEKCLRREYRERWSCDQLLSHPFLLSVCNKTVESSPRCILDWNNSLEFSEDEEEEMIRFDVSDEISAKGRIGNLATTMRVNWETEDWVAVRGFTSDVEVTVSGSGSGDEGGVNWEYCYEMGAEEETEVGTILEYSDNGERVNPEKWERLLGWEDHRGGSERRKLAGRSWQYVCMSENVNLHLVLWIRLIMRFIHSLCCCNLLLKSCYSNFLPLIKLALLFSPIIWFLLVSPEHKLIKGGQLCCHKNMLCNAAHNKRCVLIYRSSLYQTKLI